MNSFRIILAKQYQENSFSKLLTDKGRADIVSDY